MSDFDPRITGLLEQLRAKMDDMERHLKETRSVLNSITGDPVDKKIEERVQQALAALRAKSRAAALKKPEPKQQRSR